MSNKVEDLADDEATDSLDSCFIYYMRIICVVTC